MVTVILLVITYIIVGLINFVGIISMGEPEEFLKLKTWIKVIIRLSYIIFWPIYFIYDIIWMIYVTLKYLLKCLVK